MPISFLRAVNGTVSPVNDPEAVQSTFVSGINPAGVVIGYSMDENGVQHGLLRKP